MHDNLIRHKVICQRLKEYIKLCKAFSKVEYFSSKLIICYSLAANCKGHPFANFQKFHQPFPFINTPPIFTQNGDPPAY